MLPLPSHSVLECNSLPFEREKETERDCGRLQTRLGESCWTAGGESLLKARQARQHFGVASTKPRYIINKFGDTLGLSLERSWDWEWETESVKRQHERMPLEPRLKRENVFGNEEMSVFPSALKLDL